jgi:hypothetical protein
MLHSLCSAVTTFCNQHLHHMSDDLFSCSSRCGAPPTAQAATPGCASSTTKLTILVCQLFVQLDCINTPCMSTSSTTLPTVWVESCTGCAEPCQSAGTCSSL